MSHSLLFDFEYWRRSYRLFLSRKLQLNKIKKYLHHITLSFFLIEQICTVACHWITPRSFLSLSKPILVNFALVINALEPYRGHGCCCVCVVCVFSSSSQQQFWHQKKGCIQVVWIVIVESLGKFKFQINFLFTTTA